MLALLLREQKNLVRHPLKTVIRMVEPFTTIAVVCSVIYLSSENKMPPYGPSRVLFLATGFFPKYLFFYTARYIPNVPAMRRFPAEQRLDYMFVNVFLKVVEFAVFGVFLFGSLYLFVTDVAMPFQFAPILEASIAMAMLGFGYGVLNMALRDKLFFWKYIIQVINLYLIMLCGVFFVVDFLPPPIRYTLSFIPNIHAIVLFREAFYPHYPSLILDTSYLTYCAIAAGLLGLVLERFTRRTIDQ